MLPAMITFQTRLIRRMGYVNADVNHSVVDALEADPHLLDGDHEATEQ